MSEENQRLVADGSADLEKFTDLIEKLLLATWGADWGTFSEEFPTGNTPEDNPMPHITYSLLSRKKLPGRSLKKQGFESYDDPEHPGERIIPSREWFECAFEFNLYERTNRDSRKLSERFEELIERYKGFLKKQGISEILFDEEAAGGIGGSSRQGLPHRVLRYKVHIERITYVRSHELKQIEVLLDAVNLDLQMHDEGYTARFGENPHGLSNISSNGATHMGGSDFLSVYEHNFPKQKEEK